MSSKSDFGDEFQSCHKFWTSKVRPLPSMDQERKIKNFERQYDFSTNTVQPEGKREKLIDVKVFPMTQETFESDFQMAYPNTSDQHDVYHFYNGNNYGHFMSDGSIGTDESNLWSSSPRSETPSPNSYIQNSICPPYQLYKPMSYSSVDHHVITYRDGYSHFAMSDIPTNVPYVRVVKRRTTANKKERKRTQSINNAYADLRDCIPNVPADTKLSKIKTLRLATSYISYLTKALESDDPTVGFKAELSNLTKKSASQCMQSIEELPSQCSTETTEDNQRKAKGRTGWPQHVWALELKQEQTI